MACYKFKIDGVDTQVSIPSTLNSDSEFNWETFISDLKRQTDIENASENPETSVDLLVRLLDSHKKQENSGKESIKSIDKREAFQLIQKHLSRIGVSVHLESPESRERLGFSANTDAGVMNGEIYIFEDSAISSPMHEFLHLIFGVMKQDNFNKFSKLMGLMSSVSEFNTIKQQIDTNDSYRGLTDLDRSEEAFVRYMSSLLEENIEMSEEFNNVYDEINTILVPSIKKTFGIDGVVNLIDFLKSPFSDLTKQGSTLFVRKSLNTTGYSDNKYKVILSGKIMNYIQELSTGENPLIEEGECQ